MRGSVFPVVAAFVFTAAGQTIGAGDASERHRIDRIAAALEQDYVFPDVARRAASFVRDRRASYAHLPDQEFATRLTTDLQAVTRDRHLIVNYHSRAGTEPQEERTPTADERRRMDEFARSVNYGFTTIERLPGDIGYLRIDGFMPADVGESTLAAAMNSFADTRALIIDLRYSNNGGDPSMVALICAYLTEPQPIHLSTIRFRDGRSVESWTPAHVQGARYPQSRPVIVLTSPRTFSAGEELAYNLKALRRATLMGEPTGGAANPGRSHWISEHISIFVPNGEARSAITGENWGWNGVEPDIRVAADAALTQAKQRLAQSPSR